MRIYRLLSEETRRVLKGSPIVGKGKKKRHKVKTESLFCFYLVPFTFYLCITPPIPLTPHTQPAVAPSRFVDPPRRPSQRAPHPYSNPAPPRWREKKEGEKEKGKGKMGWGRMTTPWFPLRVLHGERPIIPRLGPFAFHLSPFSVSPLHPWAVFCRSSVFLSSCSAFRLARPAGSQEVLTPFCFRLAPLRSTQKGVALPLDTCAVRPCFVLGRTLTNT